MPVHIKDCLFSGFKTAIKSDGPIQLRSENNVFDNVERPFDLAAGSSGHISGTKIVRDPKVFAGQIRRESDKSASRTGWSKSLDDGPPLPSYCPRCKSTFSSKNYKFSGAYFYLWGNSDTCTVCGYEQAQLAEGIFNLTKDAAEVLSGPDVTYVMLAAIARIASDVAECKIEPEKAERLLRQISKPVADLISKAIRQGPTVAVWVGLALAAATLHYQRQGYKLQVDSAKESQVATEHVLETLRDVSVTLKKLDRSLTDIHTELERSLSSQEKPQPKRAAPNSKSKKSRTKPGTSKDVPIR